jgi:hypothetical protein
MQCSVVVRTTHSSKEGAATQIAQFSRVQAHHEALRDMYERVARRPWLSIEPDPPEPE